MSAGQGMPSDKGLSPFELDILKGQKPAGSPGQESAEEHKALKLNSPSSCTFLSGKMRKLMWIKKKKARTGNYNKLT